jgi:hypothetical protein
VGQGRWEEVDFSPDGAGGAGKADNYGWVVCEGDKVYQSSTNCPHAANGFVGPELVYDQDGSGEADGGCAVTGGHVYRGPDAPAWQGVYLFGDYCSGKISALAQGDGRLLTADTPRTISSFGEDNAGRLFLTDLGGTIHLVALTGDPLP